MNLALSAEDRRHLLESTRLIDGLSSHDAIRAALRVFHGLLNRRQAGERIFSGRTQGPQQAEIVLI